MKFYQNNKLVATLKKTGACRENKKTNNLESFCTELKMSARELRDKGV